MESLRWILLLAGLLFLAALIAWERFRPRQGRRDGEADRSERSEPEVGAMAAIGAAPAEPPAAGGRMYTGASLGGRSRTTPPLHVDLPPLEPSELSAAAGDAGGPIATSSIIRCLKTSRKDGSRSGSSSFSGLTGASRHFVRGKADRSSYPRDLWSRRSNNWEHTPRFQKNTRDAA